ncbi:MAG: IS1380 family transposase [bacterium]|nr:IS1380 family transposase [bacterium]MCP4968235.1 IS1380 family transposase [bacterium]
MFEQFCRRFRVAPHIDEHVEVLKLHLPYHESDHVLAQAMNLYVGGTCLEDMMHLQGDEAVLRMLGACRLPDPTTAGDFLRRFEPSANPGALGGLRRANDELQARVWKSLSPRNGRRRRKREWAVVDVDSHIKPLCGVQKQGADYSYKGQWSYHPLVVSMAATGECLAIVNRAGCANSADGTGDVMHEVLPRVVDRFRNVIVRGDSAFDSQALREVVEHYDAYFAFVGRAHTGRPEQATALPESAFKPFRTRAARQHEQHRRNKGAKCRARAKKRNHRSQQARARNYKEMRLVKQWLAETTYQPPDSPVEYRLIVRRQLIENFKGQQHLFDAYRYRYVVTNLPDDVSPEEVVDHTYQRCDQENLIEQMGSGLAAWRMPVAEFDGNSAWLEIARLAWNIGKWLAQLVLPDEVTRWEWKRFRLHYVLVPAQLIKRARQMWVRLMGARSTIDPLLLAFQAL